MAADNEASPSGRLRALHRALAARPNQPVLFADLISEVWGDQPPSGPLPALRTLVKRLRRSIPDEIVTDASGYRLKIRTPGPCQLPADLPDFVGREHELARLEDQEGVVTITGAPGVGKTALAVRLAHRLRERYPDGQLYVNLRAFASGPPVTVEQALSGFLRALGVAQAAIPATLDAQVQLYRARLDGKRVLVVLDNAVQDLVEPLVPAMPGCLAIVTSRHDLPQQLRLDVLSDDAAHELLARMKVGGSEDDRTELVRLCAHLPLALRIAGANVAHAHLEDYLAELRGADRLDMLEIDGDAAVRATFDLSHRALSDEAKRVFRRLGLHPGADIGEAAISALTGGDPARELGELVRAGLVDQVGERYQLHDLIRLFAASLADDADQAGLTSMYGWYLRSTINATVRVIPESELLTPPEGHLDGLTFTGRDDAAAWLEEELPNLVAVVLSAPSPFAQHLADAMRAYLHVGRFDTDKALVFRAGLRAARAAGDRAGQASTLAGLGLAAWTRSAYQEALEHYHEALTYAESPTIIAAVKNYAGLIHLESGQAHLAGEYFAESLELRRRSGNERLVSACLLNLAISYGARGELRQAAEHIEEATEITERHGLHNLLGVCLDNLAVAYYELGDLDRALEVVTRSVELNTRQETTRALANALGTLARVHADRGEVEDGMAAAARCLVLSRETQHPKAEVDGLVAMAILQPEHAERHAAAAVELGRKIGYGPGVITGSIHLARAVGAVDMIDEVLGTIRETDSFMDHSRALLARAHITRSPADAREALAAATERGQAKVAADARELLATLGE